MDEHTLAEVNELFEGWDEHPPTNILVKALVDGFSGKKPADVNSSSDVDMPPEAFKVMQASALEQIKHRAGNRVPVVRGKDPGLPKTAPIFDFDAMRAKNAERINRMETVSVGN